MGERSSKRQGVAANAIIVPVITVVAILYLVLIILVVNINRTGLGLARLTMSSAEQRETATSLLAGSSLLSETSSNFILMPLAENGTLNVNPLLAYANELAIPRRAADVLEKIRDYGVGEEACRQLETAAESADVMLQTQLHAISLVASVYPLPDESLLNTIPRQELTAEEKRLPEEERLAKARLLILSAEYGRHKRTVSRKVNACVTTMKADTGRTFNTASERFRAQRALLWVGMVAIIVILIVDFTILYRQMILPLNKIAHLIETDEPLDDQVGLREVRLLAGAYNRLLSRRAGLESILRSAAETDTLTGLPNRYGFEQYLLESGQSGYSMAVFLFDVNYLKSTNDTMGHSAGDDLIRTAARCIHKCFAMEGENNCFRFGGDEFAAVEKNCTPEKLRQMVSRFKAVQAEYGVSISWGYAYTDDVGLTTIKTLLDEADREMYARKEDMHRRLDELQ